MSTFFIVAACVSAALAVLELLAEKSVTPEFHRRMLLSVVLMILGVLVQIKEMS